MHIRQARREDIAAISRIAEAAFSVHIAAAGRRPAPMDADFDSQQASGQLYVVGEPTEAYACWFPRGDHVHLEALAVAPERQGAGLGGALIKGAEAAAREAGLVAVELYTNAAMTANIALYQQLGFEIIARKQIDGFDRVYFRKEV